MKRMLLASCMLAVCASSAMSAEILIYTGGAPSGAGSSYHDGYGSALENAIRKLADEFGYQIRRVPSNGAVDNANKCAAEVDNICFGIGQGGISYDAVAKGKVSILRSDLPGECAMAFTAEPRLTNWKTIVGNSSRVTFVVPENSGSEAFIKALGTAQGFTPKFEYVSGSDNIIAKVKNGVRGSVGFFYAYPNPTAGLIKAAYDADLHVVGVISPEVAKTNEVYYLNRKAPYSLSWYGFGETKTVQAMCSSALILTNNPANINETWTSGDALEIQKRLQALPPSAFIPASGPMAKLMRTVEGLSEKAGVADMVTEVEEQVAAKWN